jgi:tetratricopeptide (TPR) repeat protein
MAEEKERDSQAASGTAAEGIALGPDAARGRLDPRAAAYLEEQVRLSRLQSQNLVEQNAFELSHLRWRRFNDQMKGAMQIMIVAAGALIVAVIVAAMWNASQADGIVVESFSTPPGFVADGIGGDVVASDITNKIAIIRDTANGNSFNRSKDVHQDSGEDIKVEIPETGISFDQGWRYLKAWLGHERPLRGNLRRLSDGRIALTVALAENSAATFTGPASGLDALEQQAAEHVFADVDPSNYVLYLDATSRDPEAYAVISNLAQTARDPLLRSGAMSLWAVMTRSVTGNVELANARARYALALNPKMVIAHRELMVGEHVLGHDQSAFEQAGVVALARESDVPAAMRGYGFAQFLGAAQFERDADTGDFQHARVDLCFYCTAPNTLLYHAEDSARAHDLNQSRADTAAALATGSVSPAILSRTRTFMDMAVGNWSAAVADAKTYGDALMAADGNPRFALQHYQTFAAPLRATVLARDGDFAQAQRVVDATARDCYHCVRTRGIIDALQRNWNGAAFWFADAVKQAPSLPFAYADWGEMLLHQGKFDAAIAKFESANREGPHFADPLEMWGEALMAKNRSDLALAKFEEANKYAPNWGRLHLKWGEALLWSGNGQDAMKQFALAAGLDLSAADRSELARVRAGHG